jgi:hypothetical protein
MSIRRHIRRCRVFYSFAAAFALALAVIGSVAASPGSVAVTSLGLGAGQTLSGSVSWTAEISGSVTRVDFAIDGTVRLTAKASPYTFTLDTATLGNGSHTFGVTAYPTPGKGQSVSATVTATVSNGVIVQATAPTLVSSPAITGPATVGQTLTTSNGSWSGTTPMGYSYQWASCDVSGSTCTIVAGATASTFAVATSVVGSTIRAIVTASNAAGSVSASSPQTSTVAPLPTAPVASTSPTITGTAVVGQTLTASVGTWTGTTPMSYAYQWQECGSTGASCSPIAGATSTSYVVESAIAGSTVRVAVTASNSVGSTNASSAATAVVSGTSPGASTAPLSSAPPTISGTATVGQTLTASPGTWTGTTPMSYAYQWQQCGATGANCAPIAGATSASYAIGSAVGGGTVRVSVTASNSVGSASANSGATGTVAAAPTSAPTFESETAYLNTPRPDLSNAIVVSSASQFLSAMASATAGQTYDVLGTVKITSQFNGWNRVVAGGVVNVVLEPGMTLAGDSRTGYNAVHLQDSGGWRIWGGTLANPYGGGIHVYSMPGPFTWTGFTVGQVGGTGLSVFPVPTTLSPSGNISNLTLAGVMGSSSENLSYDPHAEKGTGLHCSNIADPPYGGGGGIVQNSTFAVDCLNQATGAAVEINSNRSSNVVIFARAKHLGFALPGTTWLGYATTQVAGNVIQLWGGSSAGRLDIRYAEGNDIQGRILETNGVSSGSDISLVSLDYGRATGPILQNPVLSKIAYAVKGGLKLGDALPLP